MFTFNLTHFTGFYVTETYYNILQNYGKPLILQSKSKTNSQIKIQSFNSRSKKQKSLHGFSPLFTRHKVVFSFTHLLKDCLVWLLSLSLGGFSNLWTRNKKFIQPKLNNKIFQQQTHSSRKCNNNETYSRGNPVAILWWYPVTLHTKVRAPSSVKGVNDISNTTIWKYWNLISKIIGQANVSLMSSNTRHEGFSVLLLQLY